MHESEGGVILDAGQRHLVEFLATYPAVVSLGIGPAGAGKTTAMRAFAAVLAADGRRLVPLATSAKAAEVLGHELGVRAENVHKFLHEARRNEGPDRWFGLGVGDVVLVDEASMANTLQLAEIVTLAREAGASVRLLGDPGQLASVEAGGTLRLLEAEVGAVHLHELHRFVDPAEAAATLQLRAGDPTALSFYFTEGRIREGSREAMLESAYEGWAKDVRQGRTSVLVAASNSDVRRLNALARHERVGAGQVEPDGVVLWDDHRAGAGDWIVTRSNLRGLTCHRGRDWVKNGDAWRVMRRHGDGSLSVRHLVHDGVVRLPREYVAASVELAYASTAHRTQGRTVDTAHAVVTAEMTRESLYVASTRGRVRTTWYTATERLLDPTVDREPDPPTSSLDVLTDVLRRSGSEQAATTAIRATQQEATSLPALVTRYQHAWELAAMAMLRLVATDALSPRVARRVLTDPAARQLAKTLADAAGRGADPACVLPAAVAYDDLGNVRSMVRVLASRLEDFQSYLGIPTDNPTNPPLPWLSAPSVGHREWDAYLSERGRLIIERAGELGSMTAAYREQYQLTHLGVGELGPLPPEGTTQRHAYLAASREQEATTPTLARRASTPSRHQSSREQQRGRRPSL